MGTDLGLVIIDKMNIEMPGLIIMKITTFFHFKNISMATKTVLPLPH